MAISIFLLSLTFAASGVSSLNEDGAGQCRIVPIELRPTFSKNYSLGIHSKKGSVVYKANWYEASVYCRLSQKTLATMESSEEYEQHFKSTVEKSIETLNTLEKAGRESDARNSFWTDGTNLGTDGERFYWMSTSHQLDFNNWKSHEQPIIRGLSETSKSRELCVNVQKFGSTYTWHRAKSTEHNYFICQSHHEQ